MLGVDFGTAFPYVSYVAFWWEIEKPRIRHDKVIVIFLGNTMKEIGVLALDSASNKSFGVLHN